MIQFGDNLVKIYKQWDDFKTIVTAHSLFIQYDDDGTKYTIFAIDGLVVRITVIYTGSIPAFLDPDSGDPADQTENDSFKTDFETNFKPFVNQPLTPNSNVTLGYTNSTGSTLTVMRATAYVQQTSNAQRSLVSSSADDASAGTGARTVKITYYDQTMLGPFTETVTMNGVTPVDTVASDICFIEKMETITVGSQLGNVGTITLKDTTGGGGATIGTIAAGDGVTYWCHHYVGTNKVFRLVALMGSIKGMNSGVLEVHKTTPTVANTPEYTISPKLRIGSNSTDSANFSVPIRVEGPALVLVYGRSDASSGNLDWFSKIGFYEG